MDIQKYNRQSLRILNRALDPNGEHSVGQKPRVMAPPPIAPCPGYRPSSASSKLTQIPDGWVKTRRKAVNQFSGPTTMWSAKGTADSERRLERLRRRLLRRQSRT